MALLEVRDLTRTYGRVTVLQGLDFDVEAGHAVALVGPNGIGKSTALRCIVGSDAPTSGSVSLDGRAYDERSPRVRAAVAVVMDDLDFFPDLSVVEHLDLMAKAHGVDQAEDDVDRVLADLGLSDQADQLPGSLSSGQRRRLGLATALVRPARLMVLDEPEARLDQEGRAWLVRRLAAAKRDGLAVLVASHDQELVAAVADRVIDLGGEPLTTPAARDLRADLRSWRRQRATAKLSEVLEELYVAGFAVLVLGSMVVSVLVNLSRESDRACVSAGCQGARAMLPWLVAAGAVVVLLTLARLVGPVFVSPAFASWLLPTPVARPGLLRVRLLSIGGIFAVTGALAAVVGGILGGLGAGAVAVLATSSAAVVAAAVGVAALAQSRQREALRSLDRALAGTAWVVLVATAADRPLLRHPVRTVGPAWWFLLAACLVAAATAGAAALRSLGALHTRSVTPGGRLLPAVSGALSGLDLALVYDVVVAHQSRARGFVRSRRGGPSGLGALVRLDLVRLRRHPGPLIVLLASLAVPAAARAAGGGRVVILVAALVGFLAGLPLLVALRVVSRTPALVRTLPFRTATVVQATVTVPAVALLVFGGASVPILHSAAREGWFAAALTGLAVAASALASGIRWMTARPPDYAQPLVSTPAGGVPTNLYGSVFRGFDVLLVTTTPVLLTARPQGAAISLALSLAVSAFLLGRQR